MKEYKFHEATFLFPMIEEKEFCDLVDDIRKHGQEFPIDLYEGKILDGRNRYLACRQLGIECKTRDITYHCDDPLHYVLSANLHRRHLTVTQKAMIAAKILPMLEKAAKERQRLGGKGKKLHASIRGRLTDIAGRRLGVSGRCIRDAIQVEKIATNDIKEAMKNGQIGITIAAKVAKLPPARQAEIAKSENIRHAANKMLETATIPRKRLDESLKEMKDLAESLMLVINQSQPETAIKTVRMRVKQMLKIIETLLR